MNTNAEHEAAKIIEGFLDRFEAPTCIEQQEVVSQAMAWLENYCAVKANAENAIAAFLLTHPFAAQAINQNDTQNHTD